jgi:hypothetical protein
MDRERIAELGEIGKLYDQRLAEIEIIMIDYLRT